MTKHKDVDIIAVSEISNVILGSALKASGYRFAAVSEDGTVFGFITEDEACLFQRGYRAAQGLDQWTGEAKS